MRAHSLLICFLMFAMAADAQNSVYSISFNDLLGTTISMNNYQGKKIVVAVCNTAASAMVRLNSLKSWYQDNKDKYALIVIPVSDLEQTGQQLDFGKQLLDTLKPGYVLTAAAKGRKTDASSQHSLLQWLTDKNRNGRFDNDVETAIQLFVINEKGNLFAIMENTTDLGSELFRKVINTAP